MGAAQIIRAIALQLAEEEIVGDFQAAGDMCAERVDEEMRRSIDTNVYAAYSPSSYARTYAYKEGWPAEKSGSGKQWKVETDWHATGGHTSYSGQNVDGIMDSIIIDGSSSPLYPPGPRDHVSPIDAQIENIANECLAAFGL